MDDSIRTNYTIYTFNIRYMKSNVKVKVDTLENIYTKLITYESVLTNIRYRFFKLLLLSNTLSIFSIIKISLSLKQQGEEKYLNRKKRYNFHQSSP